jgi:hypothetical protein
MPLGCAATALTFENQQARVSKPNKSAGPDPQIAFLQM